MSETIKPPEQRPEHPDFWCKRFGEGVTPWDAGKVPVAFADFVATQATPLNTLIPGCGSAWEAAHLAELGWPVTALDFSPLAIEKAREVLGNCPVNLICADFFTFAPQQRLDLIYERAFLCALPRKLWADWANASANCCRTAPGWPAISSSATNRKARPSAFFRRNSTNCCCRISS